MHSLYKVLPQFSYLQYRSLIFRPPSPASLEPLKKTSGVFTLTLVLLVLIAAVMAYAVGTRLPVNHVTTGTGLVASSPEKTFALITNIASAPLGVTTSNPSTSFRGTRAAITGSRTSATATP